MTATAEQSRTHVLYLRIEPSLNHRLDAAVLKRRLETGRRVTRSALVLELLEAGLPEEPDAGLKVEQDEHTRRNRQ